MFWTRDRVAIEVETIQQQTRARVVPPSERGELLSSGTVNLTSRDALALFEGTALEKAQRRAALVPVQFAIIFGRAIDARHGKAPHYCLARQQRRIGRVITHPVAVAALAGEPFWVLALAAREDTPERQIRAASQARIDRLDARHRRSHGGDVL